MWPLIFYIQQLDTYLKARYPDLYISYGFFDQVKGSAHPDLKITEQGLIGSGKMTNEEITKRLTVDSSELNFNLATNNNTNPQNKPNQLYIIII